MDIKILKPQARLIFAGIFVAILPVIPVLITTLIANILGVHLSDAGAPNIPYGEFLYTMYLLHWGIIFTFPIGFIIVVIGVFRLISVVAKDYFKSIQG